MSAYHSQAQQTSFRLSPAWQQSTTVMHDTIPSCRCHGLGGQPACVEAERAGAPCARAHEEPGGSCREAALPAHRGLWPCPVGRRRAGSHSSHQSCRCAFACPCMHLHLPVQGTWAKRKIGNAAHACMQGCRRACWRAGEPIGTRWTPAIKAEIKRSRVGVTRQLVVRGLCHLRLHGLSIDPHPLTWAPCSCRLFLWQKLLQFL